MRKTETKQVEANMLLDFYGALLTERSRSVLESYYSEDLTLAEIGTRQGISRQAVSDCLRRGLATLAGYEEKLGLVDRFHCQKAQVQAALADLRGGDIAQAKARLEALVNLL